MSINENLWRLYQSHLANLKHINYQIDLNKIDDFAGPHLMYVWEEEYKKANTKVLFIGQETNGWYNNKISADSDIADAIDTYKNFELGINYNSLFWQKIYYMNEILNGTKDKKNILWTNINKYGKSDIGRPDAKITSLENEYFNVLKDEINILNPEVVILFTGPNYDNDLKNKLGEIIFHDCSNHNQRILARLENKYLPYHSYRTYHPGYARRAKMEYLYEEILSIIKT